MKAIAMDIDGTITYDNRELDVSAVEYIRKAEKNSVPICLATGNILCFARATSVLLGTSGPVIAEDGGVVYDQEEDKEFVLGDVEEVDKGIKLLKEKFGKIRETSTSDTRKTGRTLERTIRAEEAIEVFEKNGLKISAVDSGFALHIKDPTVNKKEGLKKAASLLDISPGEIVAIGDGSNDVEMLREAGISFTPFNASQKAKEASDHTLSESHGEAVQKVIERVLRENAEGK